MSLKLSVNLASEPFRRTRAMLVASGAVAVLLAGMLALLITLSVAETGQAAQVHQNILRLEAQMRTLSAEQSRLEAVLRKTENAEVLDRSLFLNSLLYAKGISWTRLFDDLEKVLPYNVRLIQIRPQVNSQNQISLEMVVGADSSEPVIQMLTRLERSPQFGETLIHNRMPPSQSDPLLRFRLSVNYAQKL
jgi:type IV pilus assembly protein PilN